jgi:uncharacterized membrane protein
LLFALLAVPTAPVQAQQGAVDADDSAATEVTAPVNEAGGTQPQRITVGDPWYRQMSLAGNEVWLIFAVFVSILMGLIVGRIVKAIAGSTQCRMESRGNQFRGAALGAVGRVVIPAGCLIGLHVGLQFLTLNNTVEAIVATIISILSAVLVAFALYALVDVVDEWMKSISEKTEASSMTCCVGWYGPVCGPRSSFWRSFRSRRS